MVLKSIINIPWKVKMSRPDVLKEPNTADHKYQNETVINFCPCFEKGSDRVVSTGKGDKGRRA